MPVNIHGKNYITVNERVAAIHADGFKQLSIVTDVISHNPVLVKATVTFEKGTFTGYSAANPGKSIEKQSPYEVAETSAVGRALGFAGYGSIEGIASADEMKKGGYEVPQQVNVLAITPEQKQQLEAFIVSEVIEDSPEMRKRIDGLSRQKAQEWIERARKREESLQLADDAEKALGGKVS